MQRKPYTNQVTQYHYSIQNAADSIENDSHESLFGIQCSGTKPLHVDILYTDDINMSDVATARVVSKLRSIVPMIGMLNS